MKNSLNLRQELIKSFLGVGTMYVLAIPVGLLTNIILARTLGPVLFGQYIFVLAMLWLLALPSMGGVLQLLTREVAAFKHAGEWALYRGVVRAAHAWVLLMALLVLATYIVAGPITGLMPVDGKWALLGIVILLVPLQSLHAVRNGTIKGLGFPALAEMPTQALQPIILLLVFAVLAAFGVLTAPWALWAQVGVAALTLGIASILFCRLRPQVAADCEPAYRPRDWLMALLPFTLISLVGTFNTQIGIVLLGTLGTDEAVAVFRIGERGGRFVALSLGLVNMVISPHIVRTYREGNLQRLQQLSRQSARGAFMIALPISLILIVFGRPIIQFTFGEDYAGAYLPMVILVIGELFSVGFGSVGVLLSMSGNEKLTLWGQLAGLGVTGALAAILIPFYQAIGAAIAVVSGLVVWNIVLGYSVFRNLKIRPGII